MSKASFKVLAGGNATESPLLQHSIPQAVDAYLEKVGIEPELAREAQDKVISWRFTADFDLSIGCRYYQYHDKEFYFFTEVCFGLKPKDVDASQAISLMAVGNDAIPAPIRLALSEYELNGAWVVQAWFREDQVQATAIGSIISLAIDRANFVKAKVKDLPGFMPLVFAKTKAHFQ